MGVAHEAQPPMPVGEDVAGRRHRIAVIVQAGGSAMPVAGAHLGIIDAVHPLVQLRDVALAEQAQLPLQRLAHDALTALVGVMNQPQQQVFVIAQDTGGVEGP